MLKETLKDFKLILASGSPRRHAFFRALDLDFQVNIKSIKEIYPNHLKHEEITDYLAKLKAEPFISELKDKDILVTSDTIVWHKNEALGKPKDAQDAFNMLQSMSGSSHEVISSVCFTTTEQQIVVNTNTRVTFKELTDDEIWYYIHNYKPFDKAGAYGIQEWIGAIGILKIEGSYNNVVGLPTHLLYKTLKTIAKAD